MENRIKKVAYKTPPQENWNEFRDAEQRNPNFITEEQYKMLVEAGFTHGLGLLEHGSEIAKRALLTAEKVGLKYYVRDAVNWANILHPDYYYYNGENYKEYQKYSSFAGIYIFDEPNVSKYGDLGKMVQGYYDFFKGVGEPIVNLLPTYANHIEQLGASSYEEYIEKLAYYIDNKLTQTMATNQSLDTLKATTLVTLNLADSLFKAVKTIEKLSGKVVALPSREDVDIPVEEHLIVELYSK